MLGALGVARFVLLVGILIPYRNLVSQAPAVTLTLTPDSITAGLLSTTDVQVVIRNGSPGDISTLQLSVQPSGDLKGAFNVDRIPSLPRNAVTVRNVRIARTDSAQGTWPPSMFIVRLDYRQGASLASPPGVAYTALRVVTGAHARPEDVAEVQLVSSLAYLSDRGEGIVYVLVRNKSDAELIVSKPEVVPLPGTKVDRDTAKLRADTVHIAPYSTRFYPLIVRAENRVRPGKHLLMVTVPLTWMEGSTRIARSLVLSREIEVGVLGESEILRLLGIPSLFVLPGLLIVITFSLLWKYMPEPGRAKGLDIPLKMTEPTYWFAVLGLSILVAFLSYKLFGFWFLIDYGVGDIALLWLSSIVISAAAYAGIAGWRWRTHIRKEERERAERKADKTRRETDAAELRLRTPTTDDDPIVLLERLARRGAPLPTGTFASDAESDAALLFPIGDADSGRVWVAPPIKIQWKGDSENHTTGAERDSLDSVIHRGDPAEIAKALRKLSRNLGVHWETVGVAKGPVSVEPPADTAIKEAPFIRVD